MAVVADIAAVPLLCSTLKQFRNTRRANSSATALTLSHLRGGFLLPKFDSPYEQASFSVGEVHPDRVVYTTKDPDTGNIIEHSIPTNFVLWSTGIAMNPFTARISSLLPNQVHKKAIEVDAQLRVKGAPLGDVYAIGDCATVMSVPSGRDVSSYHLQIETSLVSHLLELVEEADRNHDGKIDFSEWEIMGQPSQSCIRVLAYHTPPVKRIKKKIPMAATHLEEVRTGHSPHTISLLTTAFQVRGLFDLYDSDADNALNLNELAVLLQEIGNKITTLPAVRASGA